jgi:hypothetical protein
MDIETSCYSPWAEVTSIFNILAIVSFSFQVVVFNDLIYDTRDRARIRRVSRDSEITAGWSEHNNFLNV